MKTIWALLGAIAIKVARAGSRITTPGYAYEPKQRKEINVKSKP